MRQINDAGLKIIERFEGFSQVAYLCPARVWTIGYGHTRGVTKASQPITAAQAEVLLQGDLAIAQRAVGRLIIATLNDNEFSALVSFTFNLGAGALQRSGLRQKLNRGEYEEAAGEFDKWVRAGGRKLAGLLARRTAERDLFLTDIVEEEKAVEQALDFVHPPTPGDNFWRRTFG